MTIECITLQTALQPHLFASAGASGVLDNHELFLETKQLPRWSGTKVANQHILYCIYLGQQRGQS